jgi:hypothetical protein
VSTLFERTKFANPSFISIRPAHEAIVLGMSAGKPGEHVYAVSFVATRDGKDVYIMGRVPKAKLAKGDPRDWSFYGNDFQWVSDVDHALLTSNTWGFDRDGANWKTMNAYSVDGVLYMFVTRCLYPWVSGDPHLRHVFKHSSLIKSTDGGKTWTRAERVNYQQPMFPGQRFGAPYLVWYGKDGAARVDNADRYVYEVSNNGHFEGGDDDVLGRVPRSRLPALDAADWSFYRGGDGLQDSSWSPKLDAATPVLSNPRNSGMTGMTYIEGLRRYVMVVWNYKHLSYATAIAKKDVSTVLEFFEAPKPWGPWMKFKTLDTGALGWYAPIIGQRFQTVVDANSVRAFMYVTGFTSKPQGGLDFVRFKMNYLPITLSTRPLKSRAKVRSRAAHTRVPTSYADANRLERLSECNEAAAALGAYDLCDEHMRRPWPGCGRIPAIVDVSIDAHLQQ